MKHGTAIQNSQDAVSETAKPSLLDKTTGAYKAIKQWFQPKNGMNHKALMRQDWTAKVEKGLVTGSMLALAVMPTLAHADVDFGPLKDLFKSAVQFLIYDMGYYLGIAAIAIQGMRAKSGRIEWSTFLWCCAGVFIVFFAPSFVDQIKQNATQMS